LNPIALPDLLEQGPVFGKHRAAAFDALVADPLIQVPPEGLCELGLAAVELDDARDGLDPGERLVECLRGYPLGRGLRAKRRQPSLECLVSPGRRGEKGCKCKAQRRGLKARD
jgi:hypothetical protein